MSITAIIPVRQGSTRLKNKNIAPFAGQTLLSFKIEQLKSVKEISKIVVSSDSDFMLNIARSLGVSLHKREDEYCDEKSKSFGQVVRHICEHVDGEDILWATCTAPLVAPDVYSKAILNYISMDPEKYDSLVSVQIFKRYLWNHEGPMNYKLGLNHVPSQQLPEWYLISDGILIAKRLDMINWNYFHGLKPYKFVLDKKSSIDIDDGLDLAAAKSWLDMSENESQIDPFLI